MKKRPIIIDTDPGVDDAVAIAIALFSDELDVKCITTVCGNVSLEKTTLNALRLLKFFNREDIPIAAGAKQPLLRKAVDASDVHGESGMEGFDFDEVNWGCLRKEGAIELMRSTLLESEEPITLLPIGPLTNIALLLTTYPEVKSKIQEIVMMGGSTERGNCGVMSEFNFHVDPEAAKIVLNSGVKCTLVPLDAGKHTFITSDVCDQLQSINKTGKMFYNLFKRYRAAFIDSGLRVYDSYAVAYLLEPSIFVTQDAFVDIEVQGEYTAGCSVVDLHGYLQREPNATVVLDGDREQYLRWFMESVKKCC